MKWSPEAVKAIEKVPFFVRKRVRKRVEGETMRSGAEHVRLEHVQRCMERYLNRMQDEVKGYQVETCFGPSGCPNRAMVDDETAERAEQRISKRDWRTFLEGRVEGPLKMHHEFRVSVSDCPNACSRPQIADVGFLGAREPRVGGEPCTRCGACTKICREGAVDLPEDSPGPVVDAGKCLFCGQCIEVCPSGTLREMRRGYRVVVGGKLGRHPRLATPVEGFFDREQALDFLDRCLDLYQRHCRGGERLGEILGRVGKDELAGEGREGGGRPKKSRKNSES